MKTTRSLAVLLVSLFSFLISPVILQAQLPSCDGNGGGLIYLVSGWPNIYIWDPGQPVSATNPTLSTLQMPMGGGGLTICNNLNSATPSPTFYASVSTAVPATNTFYYYNGSTWINTGDTLFDGGSLGGGGDYIYSRDDYGTLVHKYDGSGNAAPVLTIPGFGFDGCSDVVVDCEGNFYILDLGTPAALLRKYDPAGTLLQQWTITGITTSPYTYSAGFAIVGNVLYYNSFTTIYSGAIGASTINVTQVPGTFPWITDMASCPVTVGISALPKNDTLFNCLAGTSQTVTATGNAPYSSTVINGTATITGTGPSFEISNTLPATVVLQSKSACNIISDTFLIIPVPTVYAGPDETLHGCPAALDTLHATLANATPWVNYSYNWTPTANITGGTNTANPIIAPSANNTYTLTVTTDATQGSCVLSDEVFITVIDESITAGYTYSIASGCNEDTVTFVNTSQHNTTNLWDFGDGHNDINANPVHVYVTKGKKKVTLTAGNDYCQNSITQFIDIGNGNTWMRVPNAFSPNNDGLNDKFGPVMNNWPQGYAMRIFNRWGQMIYVTYKEGQQWDGTYNGQPADMGTYYYDIDGECSVTGEQMRAKGEFILIR